MPGSDSFWLRVNHPPARTALCPWGEVSFPTVHQISCLGSAGCATGHHDLIVDCHVVTLAKAFHFMATCTLTAVSGVAARN
jgi:hypothetical protein